MKPGVETSVSVCIPTHEPEPTYLHALLRSISAQHVPNLEVLVLDDASSFDVGALVAPWQDRLRVSFSRHAANLGMVGNWNQAVRRSCGELVMLVGQDDVLGAGMVARLADELVQRPGTALCASGEVLIDGSGSAIGRRRGTTHRSRIFRACDRYELGRDELVALCLRNGQAFGEPSAVMFRRRVFDLVGGYRDRYVHVVDIDFNLRAAEHGVAVYLNHPYLQHRVHPGNRTKYNVATGASSRDRLRLHQDYGPTVDPSVAARARVTLVSFAAYDALRAVRRRRWAVARFNVATAWRHRVNRPVAYAAHLREIVTKCNLDQR